MSVAEILAQKGNDVITADSGDTLEAVSIILAEKKIGAVMVVDKKDDVCGICSERDIVRLIAKDGSAALGKKISDCMTKKIISCEESDTINQAMEKMTEGRFRHLPIMKNGKLVGIISIGDVVKRKIEQVERDAEELKRYIAT
ncbi:MAG: CBS domain-containing protein [Rhizobiaceae bacterium]